MRKMLCLWLMLPEVTSPNIRSIEKQTEDNKGSQKKKTCMTLQYIRMFSLTMRERQTL